MRGGTQLEGAGDLVGGRYQVEGLLGRGGMGAVYRVRDGHSGAVVALKRVHARDAQRARRRGVLLEREYHMLAQLAHPRIIEVFDYGVDERGPYYTMELLAGADLSRRGALPWRDACSLLHDVASSLAILHSRGLIHRDLSTRNVRVGQNGHAKLIDFGAMTSMGVAKDVVGTPPFVPPEALQMQSLDARVDLFSLGALGYYLLTGRHAYAARSLAELRDAWRSNPYPPARLVEDIPKALSVLVLQLLSLDRNARPRAAADVMKRLCAIAGMREEEVAVSRAYLTAPVLVGRDEPLLSARRSMLSLVRGDGGCVLIDAVSGAGRSRMLDACVLEAKLIGALVLRADESDGAAGEWGVARALGAQLFQLMPQRAREATRLSRDVLAHVLDGVLDEQHRPQPSATAPEHNLIIRELRDFVLALAHGQRMVIAVDDVDRIDEASLSFLAALAHKAERNPLLLVLCADSEQKQKASASMRLLRMVSESLPLHALRPEQTESLFRSVFGDAAHLSLVASRIHSLSHGSPRATMELAQHLVSRGLARYADGSWSLPSELDERDLPSSLAASLAARLDELSQVARALAEALSLCDDDGFTLSSYPDLLGDADTSAVFRALDELVAARVLVAELDRYRFSQRGFLAVLQQKMPADRRARMHARIADLLARSGGDLLARARHLLHADRGHDAIALLCGTDLLARLPPLPLLELAVDAAERLQRPPRELYRLRIALLSRASLGLAAGSFRRAAPLVLAQLERDSGLACYRELTDVPPGERLAQALTRAQRRYLETPEDQRVLSVLDAVRELARLVGTFCSMAGPVFDLELLESLPSLEPLLPLSPALGVLNDLLAAGKDWIAGRRRWLDGYRAVLARIGEPDRAGLDDVQHARTRLGITYTLGMFDAMRAIATAEEHAQVLEVERELRPNAWRVRMIFNLTRGNAEEARKCERRAELLLLQDGNNERYLGSDAGFQFTAHSAAGDLAGAREALHAVERMAVEHPGWRPLAIFAQARHREMQGDLDGALETVMTGLEQVRPGHHIYFPALAALHVSVLRELDRAEQAVDLGRAYIATCRAEQLIDDDHPLYMGTALALSRAGQHVEAAAMMDGALAANERMGRTGLPLGVQYEARARIALRVHDRAGFERFAERCATEYSLAHNPALSLKFAALLAEAQQHHLAPIQALTDAHDLLAIASQQQDSDTGTLYSRIAECVDRNDRARCALTILLQSLDSFAGYLYGIGEGEIELLAGFPEAERAQGLDEWARGRVAFELEGFLATATTGEGDGDSGEPDTGQSPRDFIDGEGRCFEVVLLVSDEGGTTRAAAMLAVHYPPGPRSLRSRALFAEIAELLLKHGDVRGRGV